MEHSSPNLVAEINDIALRLEAGMGVPDVSDDDGGIRIMPPRRAAHRHVMGIQQPRPGTRHGDADSNPLKTPKPECNVTELTDALMLQNRHTGERLELRRINKDGQTWLALRGTLPPHQQGPPLHVHHAEAEEGRVTAGTLSALVNGRQVQIGTGGTASFPAGSVHRWWNDGDETLAFEGYVKPLVDLDRYLQAAFDVLNSGPPDRPPLFYMAHLAWRHRRTQAVLFIPRAIQAVVVPLIVLVGNILGRYRGADWPGSPDRCKDTPFDL